VSRRPTGRGRRYPTSNRSASEALTDIFYGGATRIDTDRYTQLAGNVVAFQDYADASHSFAVDAGTLPVPTADASLGNALSATFSAHRIRSNRPASAWRYLHDGTGCEAYMVTVPTNVAAGQRVWFATNPNTAAAGDTGAEIFSSTDAAVLGIANNGVYPVAFSLGGQLVAGTPTVLGYSSATSQTPDAILRRRSSSIVTGDYGSAVAAGVDPTATLGIGADTAGLRFGAFRFAAFYAFPRILTAGERATVFTWIQARYGIAP
jgi:hypothetical protein